MQNNLPNARFNGVEIQQGIFVTNYVDDSANAGDRTVNALRGRSAIPTSTNSITITNSYVNASSQIIVTLETGDTDLLYIQTVTPANGSFVIAGNNIPTDGPCTVAWLVIN